MRILLCNPDREVNRHYRPHLWMFVLQALNPPGHETILVEANTRAMDEGRYEEI